MPMIDTDLIKPASDSVQEAIDKLRDIDAEINFHRSQPDPAKESALGDAHRYAMSEYQNALFALFDKVQSVIKQASAGK